MWASNSIIFDIVFKLHNFTPLKNVNILKENKIRYYLPPDITRSSALLKRIHVGLIWWAFLNLITSLPVSLENTATDLSV